MSPLGIIVFGLVCNNLIDVEGSTPSSSTTLTSSISSTTPYFNNNSATSENDAPINESNNYATATDNVALRTGSLNMSEKQNNYILSSKENFFTTTALLNTDTFTSDVAEKETTPETFSYRTVISGENKTTTPSPVKPPIFPLPPNSTTSTTTTTKQPPLKYKTSDFNLNYLFLVLLIVPVSIVVIGIYYVVKYYRRKKIRMRKHETTERETQRLAVPSWVFKNSENVDEHAVYMTQ